MWSVGNGQSIKAWTDCWLAPGLKLDELGVIPSSLDGLMVRDLITNDGEWNLEVLARCVFATCFHTEIPFFVASSS